MKTLTTTTTTVGLLAVGCLVRLALTMWPWTLGWLQNRIEIATPLTSWSRVLEGIYYKQQLHISIYQGDLVHELPLMLSVYAAINSFVSAYGLSIVYVFVLLDVINALLVARVARKSVSSMRRLEASELAANKYARLVESLNNADVDHDSSTTTTTTTKLSTFLIGGNEQTDALVGQVALAAYILNPYTLASCMALSTSSFHTLILLLWLNCLLDGRSHLALACLALHANISVYTVVLVAASISYLLVHKYSSSPSSQTQASKTVTVFATIVYYVVVFAALCVAIFAINLYMEDFDWRFVRCTYLFILNVPDLVPNLGLFWYFFTEMVRTEEIVIFVL